MLIKQHLRDLSKEVNSFINNEIEVDYFIKENRRNFSLTGKNSVFKCIYIEYYECYGRYKDSFMFEYWVIDNLFKQPNFDTKKYCDFLNIISAPETYDYNKIEQDSFKSYFNNFRYENGFQADRYRKIRCEYYEINEFFNRICEKYDDYYIINLEEILFNMIREINNIQKRRFEIELGRIKFYQKIDSIKQI